MTTGAISRAKLQPNHHHQQTNIQLFLQAGCPSCRPTNSVKALKGRESESSAKLKHLFFRNTILHNRLFSQPTAVYQGKHVTLRVISIAAAKKQIKYRVSKSEGNRKVE